MNKDENIEPSKFYNFTENKFIVWNYSFLSPAGIYLFKFNNINSKIGAKYVQS